MSAAERAARGDIVGIDWERGETLRELDEDWTPDPWFFADACEECGSRRVSGETPAECLEHLPRRVAVEGS